VCVCRSVDGLKPVIVPSSVCPRRPEGAGINRCFSLFTLFYHAPWLVHVCVCLSACVCVHVCAFVFEPFKNMEYFEIARVCVEDYKRK